jgi:hypothetical protein
MQPAHEPVSIPEYIAALDQARELASHIKDNPDAASNLLSSIPETSWTVKDGDKQFDIPTTGLRHEIEECKKLQSDKKSKQDAVVDRVLAALDTMRAGAQSYQTPPSDISGRRNVLNKILAQREFSSVHGPTWIDRLKQRFWEYLLRILGKAFTSSAIPALSDIVVYGLMVVAVLGLAYWMYRSLRESTKLETIMPNPLAVSAKAWSIWLEEARAAAARGDWRESVHLAYWSGISFLEAQGAWRADSARTPREYLRLLRQDSEHQSALRSLTSKLELVWYGMGDADSEAFQQTLEELKRLGCPCN